MDGDPSKYQTTLFSSPYRLDSTAIVDVLARYFFVIFLYRVRRSAIT